MNEKCPICRNGVTKPGKTTLTFSTADGAIVVFRNVPADVCDNCGEPYVSSEVSKRLLEQAWAESDKGVVVTVRSYAA